jgi:hypothetical protein
VIISIKYYIVLEGRRGKSPLIITLCKQAVSFTIQKNYSPRKAFPPAYFKFLRDLLFTLQFSGLCHPLILWVDTNVSDKLATPLRSTGILVSTYTITRCHNSKRQPEPVSTINCAASRSDMDLFWRTTNFLLTDIGPGSSSRQPVAVVNEGHRYRSADGRHETVKLEVSMAVAMKLCLLLGCEAYSLSKVYGISEEPAASITNLYRK